ncbi:MAG: hypothetical protein RLZZ385_1287 [Pseudomonadota bacterium]|jgi:ABC-2 type transport system permease protein
MKIIRLIAWREYMENVHTRGFWVSILVFPLILIGIFLLQTRLSEVTPTRHYLLIDQSGRYAQAVQTAIDQEHQRQILQAFVDYLLEHRRERNLELTSANAANAADQLIEDVDSDEVAALNQWLESGGLDVYLAMASPYLEPDAPPFEVPQRQFIAADLPDDIDITQDTVMLIQSLRPYLNGERSVLVNGQPRELFALILIPDDVDSFIVRPGTLPVPPGTEPVGIQYWARNLTDSRLPDAIERSVNTEVRNTEFTNYGFNAELVRNVQRTRLPLSRLDPQAAQGEEQVSMADTLRQFAPMGFVYVMFIALMQSVQYLLSNTIEEKSNRIIEVLLASVTPNELMMGKLLGIGLSSLTTVLVWVASLLLFLNYFPGTNAEIVAQVLEVILGSELIPWFVFYSLAGYALYAGLFLAIGSLCNTLKEAQSMMMPVILLMVVPVTVMPFVVQDPNNTVYRAMSWFPLFTPYLMMNRAAASPPLIDVIGTTLLLLLSIVFMLWLSGRVFRHGVLRTGQPPKLLELLSVLRQT